MGARWNIRRAQMRPATVGAMAPLVSNHGDLPAIPDDLRDQLRHRLARLPVEGLKSPSDWAALVISEMWIGRRVARKYGLSRRQGRAVGGLHSSETNQRIVSARPDLAARHAEVRTSSHRLAYPLVNWMGNQRMWGRAIWYRLRYR